MRAFWTTIVPMLLAAALVIWGGERLARREVETRTAADRERMFDFSATLRGELDRLDDLYRGHLLGLAAKAPYVGEQAVAESCERVAGIRECHVFQSGGKRLFVSVSQAQAGDARLPEVELEGKRRPLNLDLAVVLPASLMVESELGKSGIIPAPEARYEVRWVRPDHNHLVAFTVDVVRRQELVETHLRSWLEQPFAPLREAGELVEISGPGGHRLVGPLSALDQGAVALLMPHRNSLGEWQVQAWDQRRVQTKYDQPTLIGTASVAVLLVLVGVFLFLQQRRALRLAEERVSFVNRVSHELGTPLTNILLNLDLAKRMLGERSREARRRLALVNEEAQRLARLVSNVLTFSRQERNQIVIRNEACLPDEVIAGVLAQFQPSLDRRGVLVEWKGQAQTSVRMDTDAAAQIIGNLISNVEKYASAGGWMRIESRIEDRNWVVTIADRGPGIPARQRERIFEAFERVHHGVNEGSSGTGLGLSIARDLAQRMGGDLVLEPGNAGAIFRLSIPVENHLEVVKSHSVA